jgi:hypothetical protein
MAGKAGGVARIVSGVMGDVDVRKPDRPNNESTEQSSEHCRGDSVGPGEGLRPGSRSGADDLRLHDRIRAGANPNTVYLMRPVLRQSRNCRTACLVDEKRIKKPGGEGFVPCPVNTGFERPALFFA